jgi:hypothetical protein
MRAAKTLGHKIVNWELSNNNIKPYLEEMPYLKPIQGDLESLIGRAKDLDSRQEVARGLMRELTRERQDVEKEAEDLRRRLASHLRGSLGFTNEKLIQFGINPRPRATRPRSSKKKKKEEQQTGAQPSGQPST